MKNFIIRFTAFFLIVSILLIPLEIYKIYYTTDYTDKILGREVYHSLFKSLKKKQIKKLIIGDSTGNQLYSNYLYNDSVYSLTCNQAITFAGQYFLLYNFLEANKEQLPQEVIMISNPIAFGNNLDKYTFQYFLKPFYTEKYKKFMEPYLLNRMKIIPLYFAAQLPFIKTSNYSPRTRIKNEDYGFSPLSKIYFEKIVELCKENNVAFRLEPGFVKESNRKTIENLVKNEEYKPDIDPEILNHYFNSVTYCNDSLFIDFWGHFKKDKIPYDYLKLVQH